MNENLKAKFEKIIENLFPVSSGINGVGWHQITEEDRQEFIDAMQQAYELALNDAWISVDDRLPKKMVPVLCINNQGYMKVGGFWQEEKYFSGDDAYNNITHWMPLPEPPINPKSN